MKTLKDFKQEIKNATSKEQLRDISYEAFLVDDNALSGKTTLYNRVITACIQREDELGL